MSQGRRQGRVTKRTTSIAFLNATYSCVQVLEVEAKRGLKEGAASKKQAKAAFRPWYETG